MRKLLLLITLLGLGYFSQAQVIINNIGGITTLNKVKNQITIDSAFRKPLDTLASAPIYSEAYKNGLEYYKAASGHWVLKLLGLMLNYGNAPGWQTGTLAGRPAASTLPAGTQYTASDVGIIYLDTLGTGWKQISNAGSSGNGDSSILYLIPPLNFKNDTTLQLDTAGAHFNAYALQGIPISRIPPTSNQTLQFNSTMDSLVWITGGGGGFTNPMTSVGDLIIGTTAGAAIRLGIGPNTYVLTSNGTTASWQPSAGGAGSQTLQQTFNLEVGGSVFTKNDTAVLGAFNWLFSSSGGVLAPLVTNSIDFGTNALAWKTMHALNWVSPGGAAMGAAAGANISFSINGIAKLEILASGQPYIPSLIANAFPGTSGDSVLTINNGLVRTYPIASITGGGGSQTWQQVFSQQANNAILTFSDTVSGRQIVFSDSVIFNNVMMPGSPGGGDVGTATNYFNNVHTTTVSAPTNLVLTSPGLGAYGIQLEINGSIDAQVLYTGQWNWGSYRGNVFPGIVTGGTPDSILTIGNGLVKKVPLASIVGSTLLTRQSITSGTSVTGTTGALLVTFNFSSTVASYTFTMPPSPTDQQTVEFEMTAGSGSITTLTVSPNAGQTINAAAPLNTFQPGEFAKFKYNLSTTSWNREN